jgi:hypothetical protein
MQLGELIRADHASASKQGACEARFAVERAVVKYKVIEPRDSHVYEIELATLDDLLEFVFTTRGVLVRSGE